MRLTHPARALPVALLGLSLLVSGSASAMQETRSPFLVKETALLLDDHALAGTIWDLKSGTQISKEALIQALAGHDHVLLGEKHDNKRHHAIQAELVAAFGASSAPADIIFEMVEPAQASAFAAAELDNLDQLGEAVTWEARGWPSWSWYQPIVEAALKADMALKAGNPDRAMLMDIGRGGSLDATLAKDLNWEKDFSADQRESLLEELVGAHCGMMGKEQMGPLVTLQRLKDAFMGRAMRKAFDAKRASILIAGNGHIRNDRGVPWHLAQDAKAITISIQEVSRDALTLADYETASPELYDYVWFTPRVDEIDPCDKFRDQLKRMKEKMSKKKAAE